MVILYCGLVLGCVLFGVCVSKRFTNREKFYEELVNFLSEYKSNLYFRQVSFKNLIKPKFDNEMTDFRKFLNSVVDESPLESIYYLTEKELSEVKEIILNLGESGLTSAEEVVIHAREIASKNLEVARHKKQKYAPMSIKLSLMIGLLLVILLI